MRPCPPREASDAATTPPEWRADGLRFFAYGHHLKRKFGQRVQKVSLDAGFVCPNVDGTVAYGGCVFCDIKSFSPSRRQAFRGGIAEQLAHGMARVRSRYKKCDAFIAYFQPSTNTRVQAHKLQDLIGAVFAEPAVRGVAVSARPDCLADDILEVLADAAREHYVVVELGIQSIHDESLAWMNRGHDAECSRVATRRCRELGLEVTGHVILGLPTETESAMMATPLAIAEWGVTTVKLHNLMVIRGAPLNRVYAREPFELLSCDRYVRMVCDILERLPPDIRIDRIGGDAPPQDLVAPRWRLEKASLRKRIEDELARRGTWQGKKAEGGR